MLRKITITRSLAGSAKRRIFTASSLSITQVQKKAPQVRNRSPVQEKLSSDAINSARPGSRSCKFFEEHFQADAQVLCNYLQACLFTGLFTHALNILEMRIRTIDGKLCRPSGIQVSPSKLARETQVYDVVLGRLASISPKSEINCSFMENTKTPHPLDIILKIFSEIRRIGVTPSASSYASVLEAMSKCSGQKIRIELCLQQAQKDGHSIADIIGTCIPGSKSAKNLHEALSQVSSYDDYNAPMPINTLLDTKITNLPILVKDLYESHSFKPGSLNLPSVERFDNTYADQIETEKKRVVKVDNILRPRVHTLEFEENKIYLSHLLKEWRASLLKLFQELKKKERARHNEHIMDWEGQFSPGSGSKVYPFLCLLPEQEYVDIMLDQLCSTMNGGEFTTLMSCKLGEEVYSRFHVRRLRDTGILSRLEKVYMDYTDLFISNELQSKLSSREFWLQLEDIHGLTNLEEKILPWNRYWSLMVGIKLVEILSTVSFSPNDRKCHRTGMSKKVPAVYNSYVVHDKKQFGMTVPHPQFRLLLKNALDKLHFESEVVPMVVPPRPWCGLYRGGLLVNQVEFMRSSKVEEATEAIENLKEQNLIPIFDSLNILGSVAWIVNKPILNLQIKYFCDKGSKELSIPQPASMSEPMPNLSIIPNRESVAYKKARRKAIEIQKERQEMHALFMEGLYKLSIANAYRDKVIWFAHNIDFRGRFYPVSRHLNYMGSDLYRSLFLFATGRPLGAKGLDWLKLHCINLTDFKKHSSVQERLEYADEVMDDILSSANNPEADDAWWKTSDKPWQTLAVCIEIDKALKSPDPTKFISHLPVHQDGSCNGLQHYAALGRDIVGAQQVNLSPSITPQDVYVGVAKKAEEFRKRDAERGNDTAKVLDGFVRRKVVKQTVMTTVYGVTRYGAVQQIKRQLGYLEDEFPKVECGRGASYLADKVFGSITEMFSGARNIQHWLIQIADAICKLGHVVDWRTPLNLLVSQPYYKHDTKYIPSHVQRFSVLESLPSLPNCRKQVNGFPPNFIHSLDSTHMMLTALHCHRAGITFASVHDCFWTHACDVDAMGQICRQQFVALHSQPILHQLAEYLRKHIPPNSDPENLTPQQAKLKALLDDVPEQGKFDLNEVISSTFFFS